MASTDRDTTPSALRFCALAAVVMAYGWGYRGTIGPTFELNPMGAFRPYMGIYGGYITGKGAQDGPLVGPELGFKVGMGDQAYMYTKIGYDYLFRNSWDEGIPNAGIGFGYRF